MQETTIILHECKYLDRVNLLGMQAISSGVMHEVVIREHKVNISSQQRKLYFLWIGIISNELGYTKEEMHLILKKKYLINIYIEYHEGFSEMIEALRDIRNTDRKAWRLIADYVLAKTSIMDAKVKEMRLYLTDIDMFAADNDIRLPLPNDRDLDERVWRRA